MYQHQVLKCVGLMGLIAWGSASVQAAQVNSELSCSDLLTVVYNQDYVQIGAQNYGRACTGERTQVSTRDNARCMELSLCVVAPPNPPQPDYPSHDDGSSWGGGYDWGSGGYNNGGDGGGGGDGAGGGGSNGTGG